MALNLYLVALTLLAPSAAASASFVVLENGHDSSGCLGAFGPHCLVSGSTKANDTIDASQRTTAVGILVLTPWAVPLLSDGSLVLRGDELTLPNPVSPMIAGVVGQRNFSVGGTSYIFFASNERDLFRYGYYGPRYDDLGFAHREAELPGGYSTGDRGLKFDSVTPSDVGEDDADHQTTATTRFVCESGVPSLGCDAATAAQDGLLSSTPNVRIGLQWEAAGAATERAHFGATGPAASPGAATEIAATSPAQAESPQLWPAVGGGQRASPEPDARGDRRPDPVRPPASSAPAGVFGAGVVRPVSPSPPAAGFALAAAAASVAIAVLLAALYARIRSREEALGHDHRRRLLEILAMEGPRTIQQLGDALSVDRTTALYHVRILRRSSSVMVAKQDRSAFVHLPGQALPPPPAHRGGRAADDLLRILGAAAEPVPRSALHGLAAHLPLRARNQAIRDLTDAGLIVRGFAGNEETLALARGAGRAA